jgi:hypothetical protein
MGKRMLNGCLAVSALFFCPLAVILAIGGGSLVYALGDAPADVDVEVSGPENVAVGESFTIDFAITNTALSVQTLDDIDLDADAVDSLAIVSSEPSFIEATRSGDTHTYWFEREITPGSTLNVSFTAVASEAGTYPLWISVCINSAWSCTDFEAEVVAK